MSKPTAPCKKAASAILAALSPALPSLALEEPAVSVERSLGMGKGPLGWELRAEQPAASSDPGAVSPAIPEELNPMMTTG